MYLKLTANATKTNEKQDSPLWRIFRGCGHSFHLECNLPGFSVCTVCKSLLESEIASLSKTANDAVKKFNSDTSGKDEFTSDNEDSSDDEDNASDNKIDNDVIEQQRVVGKISSWTHVQPPKQ